MPVGILLDTKGPEVHTGLWSMARRLPSRPATRSSSPLSPRPRISTAPLRPHLSITALPSEVEKGSLILIDDGTVCPRGRVRRQLEDMTCVVKNDGLIGERKGVNMPNVNISLPAITERDRQDIPLWPDREHRLHRRFLHP